MHLLIHPPHLEKKIRKISPGAYISQRPFLRGLFLEGLTFGGLSTEGNLPFKIDWASLIVESKFTVFTLIYFVFEGNFSSTSPRGAYIWRGDLTKSILRYRFGGLIFGEAYTSTWRFFFGILRQLIWRSHSFSYSVSDFEIRKLKYEQKMEVKMLGEKSYY